MSEIQYLSNSVANVESAASIIDNNFNLISNAVDNLNTTIGFLDTVHIVSSFRYEDQSESGTIANCLSNFMTVWANTATYEGVIMQNINYSSGGCHIFQFDSTITQVGVGDILIKKPDSSALYIKGLQQTNLQAIYNESNATLEFQAVESVSSDPIILTNLTANVPIVRVNRNDLTAHCTSSCYVARFYTQNGEQVLLPEEVDTYIAHNEYGGLSFKSGVPSIVSYAIIEGYDD